MKKPKTRPTPAPSNLTVLRQLLNFIPTFLVPTLAKDTGVDKQSRTFPVWSHIVALSYAQLIHVVSFSDLCDALRLNCGPLFALRGATPPSKHNFSHANILRDVALAEELVWSVHDHLKNLHPCFAGSPTGRGVFRRFSRVIHVVDSTTTQLVAACMDWARHRRRKSAAKCHLRLDLQSFLPRFAIVDNAKHHDNKRPREVCAGVETGKSSCSTRPMWISDTSLT